MTKQEQFLSYAHAFLVAAEGHATAANEKGVDGEVDGMMCIIALQNSVVGAIRTLGKGHHAVQKYKEVGPRHAEPVHDETAISGTHT